MSAALPMPTLIAMAWRNLWRNSERSWVMIGALAIAIAAMLFLIAMMRGLLNDMSQQNLRALPGDIQIHPHAYLDDPAIEYRLPWPSGDLRHILDGPLVARWSGRISVGAMIASERENRGIQLIGYLPSREGNSSFNEHQLITGIWPADHDRGVVVGGALLDKLDTDLGKRIVLTSQGADGEIAEMGAPIIGVFKAEMAQTEERLVYIPLPALQQMLRSGEDIQQIAIFSATDSDIHPLQAHLKNALPTADIQRWDQLNSYLSAMLDSMDAIITILIVVMFITLAFGLINTLIMAIFERVKEIGLMLALGLKPSHIALMILAETCVLLILGIVIGNSLAGLAIYSLHDGIDLSAVAEGFAMIGAAPSLTPQFLWRDVWLCNGIVITLGLLCSLLPAWRAAHYSPIEALYRD
ncbi:MAG TPA: FtsX-like permease family protein [Pseudomonadales bacterium]|nr:FtsX-like permease family protein [Pseudomonadales bacterium]